jgi:uncharacterized protein with HEPN domain
MRYDRERLLDMLEAIEKIESYASQGRMTFDNDELVQTWVVHHILIIGEAAARVSNELREIHTEVPWPQIISMRNILVPAYFSVDVEEVWSVVERDLPDLKMKVLSILHEEQ